MKPVLLDNVMPRPGAAAPYGLKLVVARDTLPLSIYLKFKGARSRRQGRCHFWREIARPQGMWQAFADFLRPRFPNF